MTKLAAALVLFGGSLLATHQDSPAVTRSAVAPKEKRHEMSLPRVSRRHERLPLAAVRTVPPRPQPAGSPWTTLESTAYCATGSRNAAGNWPTVGTVAANGYPLGTRLEVRGRGVVTVEDRSAVGATELDFYLGEGAACAAAAARWGRRYVEVREAA